MKSQPAADARLPRPLSPEAAARAVAPLRTLAPPSSGVTLGGIGAGGIELWPDGVFRNPGFLNTRPWAARNRHAAVPDQPPFGVEDLCFLLRVKSPRDAEPQLRFLFVGEGNAFRSWGHMSRTYKYARLPAVSAIDYEAEGARVRLRYHDDRLPLALSLEAWSPLIPHEVEPSLTPGVFFDFTARNLGSEPLEVSVCLLATNLAAFDQPRARHTHHALDRDDALLVTLRGQGETPDHPTVGEQAVFVRRTPGARCTAVAANPWLENLIHPFYATGDLDGPLLPADLSRQEYLPVSDGPASARNRAWVCARARVEPAAEAALGFGYAWYFPHHVDEQGDRPGKAYARRHADVVSVADAMLTHRETWREGVARLPELLRASDLPPVFAAALLDQLSTLARTTWVTADDTFFIWEGYGEACLNTVDVDHYGSHAVALLWPALRRSALDHTLAGQRPDGRIPHGYGAHHDPAKIAAIEYTRWDCQCHYVLAVHREWRFSGDDTFFARHQPAARRAMDLLRGLVPAGTALPIVAGGITYDHWHMEGVVTYLANLYATALAALAELSEHAGDTAHAALCREQRAAALAEIERTLWGEGHYLTLAPRPPAAASGSAPHPTELAGAEAYADYAVGSGRGKAVREGLHTDALNGEACAALFGLPAGLRPERVRATLRAVVGKNYHADARFLANGSSPDGGFPDLFPFCQWQNPWTGTEYHFAAHLFAEGLHDEALALIEAVHLRLAAEGMRFNHIECGDHYSRALSIYAAYLAWSGVHLDIPRGRLRLAPPASARPLTLPLITPTALGLANFDADGCVDLALRSGELSFREIALPAATPAELRASLNGCPLAIVADARRDDRTIRFAQALRLSAGDRILLSNSPPVTRTRSKRDNAISELSATSG